MLLYLGTGRDHLDLRAITDVDAVIVGGEPFDEDVLVWWNFVARTRDEVSEAARQWNASVGDLRPQAPRTAARLAFASRTTASAVMSKCS